MNATTQQIGLLHHTLGLRPDYCTPCRNHFVAGDSHHDMPDLQALETLGLMARSPTPKFCDASDIVFHVTAAGKALAIEKLPPAPKRTRYDDYLSIDGCESFGEFLIGEKVPKFETEGDYKQVNGSIRYVTRHRMYRVDSYFRDIQGEWCATKKAAKSSYKIALEKSKS
ncbi:MAG: hypothetical protein V4772_08855 [Pseudomonadota bacterium]